MQHHATPQHLYLTTRRCFIGPIPDSWLSKHRKSWYRYRPHHLSTYSSRTASFTASENVSPLKSLTGLDKPSRSRSGRFGLSFPQPDDANEEGDNRGKSSRKNDVTSGSATTAATPTGERLPEQEEGASGSGNVREGTLTTPQSSRIRDRVGPFKRRKDNTKSTGGSSSFVTAQESLRQLPANDTITEMSEHDDLAPNKSRQGQENSHEDPQHSNRNNSNRMSSLCIGPAGEEDTIDSTSSLLPHKELNDTEIGSTNVRESEIGAKERGAEASKTSKSKVEPALVNTAEALPDDVGLVANPRQLKHLEPTSTGLVRFNVPDTLNDSKSVAQESTSDLKMQRLSGNEGRAGTKPGQLLKAERMLVRIESTRHELPDNYSENDSQKAESRLVDKWRELIVICRIGGDESSGFVLQMSKTRAIPALDRARRSRKISYEIPLTRNSTEINMYSSLDKTIVIWTPHKEGTRICILRPSSTASSVEWLTFLNSALGLKQPSSLNVHVPDLNLNLELDNPLLETDFFKASLPTPDDSGEQMSNTATLREGRVAKVVITRCLDMLRQSFVADVMDTWAANGERIGLAWKRYDRLEWIYGANEERMYGSLAMQRTHDLELRPKRHYPTQVSGKGEYLAPSEEPVPVEGFLVRLTSQKGRGRRFGKTFFKKLYFSTHDQFLCFTTPAKAIPPKSPKLPRATGAGLPSASEIVEKTPLIFGINPFPVQNGKIAWLAGTSLAKKKELDEIAFEESQRVIQSLQASDGYINLCHVVRVHKARTGTFAPSDQAVSGDGTNDLENSEDSDSDNETLAKEDLANCFELVLKNGLVVRLRAYDKETRKEWVNRLRKIVKYWKLRIAEDMNIYKRVRHNNLKQLDIDEAMESYVGQFAQKWELSRALASADLFNMCGIACCRSVTVGPPYLVPNRLLNCTLFRCLASFIVNVVCIRRLLVPA